MFGNREKGAGEEAQCSGYLSCPCARDNGLGLSAWLGFYRVLGNDYNEVATLKCSTALGALAKFGRTLSGDAQQRGLLSTSQSSSPAPLREPHSPILLQAKVLGPVGHWSPYFSWGWAQWCLDLGQLSASLPSHKLTLPSVTWERSVLEWGVWEEPE